jgi:serine/threonine protein kinase
VSLIILKRSENKLVWKLIVVLHGKTSENIPEVIHARTVQSPFTVDILDSFIFEGSLYLVMEYYEKGTLHNFLNTLKISDKLIEERVFFFIFLFH